MDELRPDGNGPIVPGAVPGGVDRDVFVERPMVTRMVERGVSVGVKIGVGVGVTTGVTVEFSNEVVGIDSGSVPTSVDAGAVVGPMPGMLEFAENTGGDETAGGKLKVGDVVEQGVLVD